MNNIVQNSISDISVKTIDTSSLPESTKVDSRTFSRLLDNDKVVASYKMYWLLGILEEVTLGNMEIEFHRIIARYINRFCDMQYRAVTYISEKGKQKYLESYIDALKIGNFQQYLKYKPKEAFTEKLKQCISPLYQIAKNQGFEVMDRMFYINNKNIIISGY